MTVSKAERLVGKTIIGVEVDTKKKHMFLVTDNNLRIKVDVDH